MEVGRMGCQIRLKPNALPTMRPVEKLAAIPMKSVVKELVAQKKLGTIAPKLAAVLVNGKKGAVAVTLVLFGMKKTESATPRVESKLAAPTKLV